MPCSRRSAALGRAGRGLLPRARIRRRRLAAARASGMKLVLSRPRPGRQEVAPGRGVQGWDRTVAVGGVADQDVAGGADLNAASASAGRVARLTPPANLDAVPARVCGVAGLTPLAACAHRVFALSLPGIRTPTGPRRESYPSGEPVRARSACPRRPCRQTQSLHTRRWSQQ